MSDATPRPQVKIRKAPIPLLEIRNLTKSFGGQHTVDDVNLTIYKGEISALFGVSGRGESTLLCMLAGFELPTIGQVMLDGVDLAHVSPCLCPTSIMLQSYALFLHTTVEQSIAFGLKQGKLPKAEIASRVNEVLELAYMQEFAKRKSHQLPGGQRQCVALARSLARRLKLLLLDEPMGALDKKLRDRMQLKVVDILERVGVTCVMVIHDQEEAATVAGRIATMNRGKFVQIGEPEGIYEHPTTRHSAEFTGSVNVLEGLLKERQEDGPVIEPPGLVHPLKVDAGASIVDNAPVYVVLRPEKIMLYEAPPPEGYNSAVDEVVHIAYLGDLPVYHVHSKSGQMLNAQLQNEHHYRKGLPTWSDEARLRWDADSCVVLMVQGAKMSTLEPLARADKAGRFALFMSRLQVKHGCKLVIALPYVWLLFPFLLPFLIVLKISLAETVRAIPPYTDLVSWVDDQLSITLNLANFLQSTDDPLYFDAYLQSLQVAGISTICCLLLGYPLTWAAAHSKPSTCNIPLLLVILSFWTSSLIRVYAWMGTLKNNGVLNDFLMWLGAIDQSLTILRTNLAVYIGIVYAYLSFMVLPIYTALTCTDHSLVEAALNLGVQSLKTFFSVVCPLYVSPSP